MDTIRATLHALVLCLHSSHTYMLSPFNRQNAPFTPSPFPSQQAAAAAADAATQESEKKDAATLPFHNKLYHSCLSCLRNHGCSSHSMKQQEGVDGLYYRDYFNDSSWACSIGTTDDAGIWMNKSDQAGTIMACLVWLLLSTYIANVYTCTRTNMIPILFL